MNLPLPANMPVHDNSVNAILAQSLRKLGSTMGYRAAILNILILAYSESMTYYCDALRVEGGVQNPKMAAEVNLTADLIVDFLDRLDEINIPGLAEVAHLRG